MSLPYDGFVRWVCMARVIPLTSIFQTQTCFLSSLPLEITITSYHRKQNIKLDHTVMAG